MFGGLGQFIDNILGRPPKANANDPYRREYIQRAQQQKRLTPAELAAGYSQQIEGVIGPLSDHTPMPVRPMLSNPNISVASSSNTTGAGSASSSTLNLPTNKTSHTDNPSGSTSTLTPPTPQPTQLPGTVPIQTASSAKQTLNSCVQLLGRSNLKYNVDELISRCETLQKLIDDMTSGTRDESKFAYEITRIDGDARDIIRFLTEWNKKNVYRQALGKKEMHIQLATFDRTIGRRYQELAAIDGRMVSQQISQVIRGNEPEDNQVQDSEFQQHVRDLTGQDPGKEYILKGKIRHRENVAIGSSNNFDVYKGELVEGQETVAIKIYREKIVMDQKCVRFVERMMRQVSIWTSFSHPSILECRGIGMQVSRTAGLPFDRLQFYLVSPYLPNGDAPTFISKRRRAGTYVNVLRIIRDTAVGIQYLHSRQEPCVHASVRGENVLIKNDGTACINGFGLTKASSSGLALSEKKPIELTGKNFQVRWMAPELLTQDRPPLRTTCDIWSWGMTALELISGLQPYHDIESDYGVRDRIVDGYLPDESKYPEFSTYSPQPAMMWALLQKCWNMKPGERPTIDQVIAELDEIERVQITKQAEEKHRWT